jgi:phosphoribosylanthranilate isomerase
MTRVKICGITSAEDAAVAVEAGADALGFVLVPGTPRFIQPEAAARILEGVPPFVVGVGVFVDRPLPEMRAIAAAVRLQAVQLHGDEPEAVSRGLPLPVIKAVRVRDAASLHLLFTYPAQAFLLEAFVAGRAGGTGQTFPWELAAQVSDRAPIILSGGLHPGNVAQAIAVVRPYGVDVSSGVERAPGQKDRAKVKEFISHVRQTDRDESLR